MSSMFDHETAAVSPPRPGPAGLLERASGIVRAVAQPDLTALALRVALAVPFYKSGILKWDGFLQLSSSASFLFASEFKLHIAGAQIGYPFPDVMAFAAGIGEIVLPILLVIGLFTRFAALGLLVMTAIIQLTVPSGWAIHLTWAAMALAIMALGPGRIAADRFVPGLK
ncbi:MULTISPECIES: DoxX family protein [unclassified Roseitalea]|uniref:DoxX family protein n=1 Tax=unclassified Roseitalea TaxID=2639107 RepID=UPI00273F27ED|nr:MULTISPECIES: DoxX family protein [unclassified Roseitalea]